MTLIKRRRNVKINCCLRHRVSVHSVEMNIIRSRVVFTTKKVRLNPLTSKNTNKNTEILAKLNKTVIYW